MLDDLHAGTFAAHMHTAFRIDLSSVQAIALELVEAKDGASSEDDGVYLCMEWAPDKHPLMGHLVPQHRTDLSSVPA